MADYDKTDIPERYTAARQLPPETVALWMSVLPDRSAGVVVDLGCGNGRFSGPLAARYRARVFGIDPSKKMLAEAAAHNSAPGVEYRRGSAEAIPLPDDSADLAFLSQVYHHIADLPAALAEVARVLKPDGTLCIRNSTLETMDSVLYIRFFPTARDANPAHLCPRQELIDAVTSGGFALESHTTVTQVFAGGHRRYAEKIGLRTLSDLAALPDAEFEAGMAALRSYCSKAPAGEPVREDIDLFIFTPGSKG